MFISWIFRTLPSFRGKIKAASFFLKNKLDINKPASFKGKFNLNYKIPNTIDFVGKELYINGVYEQETISLIQRLLKKSAIFFDVGANIGSICMPVAKLTKAKVHAFEASVFIYKYLLENVHQNGLSSIVLNNAAVHSSHNIKLKFYATEEKHGGSSLSPVYTKNSYEVNSISIDEYCLEKDIKKIDVLKIDVQGFEIEVLKGCQSLLGAAAIENIIFELEEWAERDAGYDPGASQQYLLNMGYEIYTLQNQKLREVVVKGSQMFLAKPLNKK